MMKSKRFEPIQEIASTSAKDLSRAMGEAGRKVADLERQLQQLQTYRDEYVRNSAQGAAVDRCRQAAELPLVSRSSGRGAAPANEALEIARAEYEKRRAEWSEKRIEAESLGRVVDRFRKEEQHAADRREQREGDDAALRTLMASRIAPR